MKLFEILFVFGFIIGISTKLDYTTLKFNSMEVKYNLTKNMDYYYHLDKEESNYFEFQIELNKDKYNSESISLIFGAFSSIISFDYEKYFTIKSEIKNIEFKENNDNLIIKGSLTFSDTNDYIGIIITPKQNIDKLSIRIKSDYIYNDYISIIVLASIVGVCILFCVLSLIFTKACGTKESDPMIIDQAQSILMKNEEKNEGNNISDV